jgi:hypothetical protein
MSKSYTPASSGGSLSSLSGQSLWPVRAVPFPPRASAFSFFGVKLPAASFEENIHRKVAKVEEGSQNEALYQKLFDLFDIVVKNSKKT